MRFCSLLFCFLGSILFISCKEKPLFKRLDPKDTGITFSNRITENDTMNILDFEYVYNGAGIGVADFNNDGLQDVFFSGNQVSNKLYINKGDFKFEDVSKLAGVDIKDRWCAGVTPVDINADGLMDVYVSVTVRKPDKERQNLLFVNKGIKNGVPSFEEMAAEYGVNDDGHSENASFFDYDNDGDLDLYVLTNIVDASPNNIRKKKIDGSNPNTDRLYRCDWSETLKHPIYTNVSKEAGITIEGYGLGMNICDINKDGWKDIYVTNDFAADDLLYINNQDGTFSDQSSKYFKHTSNSAMGNDIVDINNDGYLDVFAVDMLANTNERKKVLAPPSNYHLFNFSDEHGYTYQYMRNTLQLNNGVNRGKSPMFSEISLLAGVAETDWSWTPSLADFDNDGLKDLLITNGFPKDVTDRDFMAYRSETERLASRFYMLEQIPEVKISNYAYRNKGDLTFEDVTKKWGLDVPSFSNGAVYVDLDNDGDLDYLVNNINDSAFVYKNTLNDSDISENANFINLKFKGDKLNINGVGAVAVLELMNGEQIIHENNPYRGYLSSVEPIIHFGLGNKAIKNIKIYWYNGKMEEINNLQKNSLLVIDISNAKQVSDFGNEKLSNNYFNNITEKVGINFIHTEKDFIDFNVQNLLPFKLSELGPGMSVGDINNDKLEDVFIGGPYTQSGVFLIQQPNGLFKEKYLLGSKDQPSKIGEDLGSLIADFNGDGFNDLYICKGGYEDYVNKPSYQDEIYINDGKGNFVLVVSALPQFYLSTSCVRASDIDNDGDLDLVVSGRNTPTQYPKFTSSKILRNDSNNGLIKFVDVTNTVAPELNNLGLVCDALFSDFDNDGFIDLIFAGEWSDIMFFKNNKGKFSRLNNSGIEKFKGFWTSINGADFDQDGDIDYIVGNQGNNTLYKATQKEPFKVIAKDFDNNGNYDLIPFTYFNTKDDGRKLVPFNGRDDVNKQLNAIRSRFVSYKDFVRADYDNLLTKEERDGAQELDVNFTSSVYIENLGGGKFKCKALPQKAQLSVLNGIVIQDFNNDGFEDLLLSGNNFGNETTVGRYDASNGLCYFGDGKGNFKEVKNSGYYVPFNAKSTVSVFDKDNKLMIFSSQNRGPLEVFSTNLSKSTIQINPKTKYILYDLNGKKIKKEIYYGSSYLGQSSRSIALSSNVQNIIVK